MFSNKKISNVQRVCSKNDLPGPVTFLGLYFIWRLSKSPAHGYSLVEEVRTNTPFKHIKMSTVYLVLSKLETSGLVKSARKAVGMRVRKIYTTTKKGRELFESKRGKHMHGPIREFMAELLGLKLETKG
ncbi:MAG: PadR family transcriptional regulator [Candidatus Micrarchaeia archaeon]